MTKGLTPLNLALAILAIQLNVMLLTPSQSLPSKESMQTFSQQDSFIYMLVLAMTMATVIVVTVVLKSKAQQCNG